MEYLKNILSQLEQVKDSLEGSRNRVRIIAWSKHGECEDITIGDGYDLDLLRVEIEEALQNAARWQAIVDTGRAIFEAQ